MKLTDLTTIRELMERHGVKFQKKFGQNFLISEQVPKNIADAACGWEPEKGRGKGILEIGPGIGTLTRELAARADKVVALEIDTGLMPILDETLADFPNASVINRDVLKTDLQALIREEFPADAFEVAVAANLPYYITTPIIMKLVESRLPFEYITVMIQKEVAVRLAAPAGDPEYGAITAALAYYGSVERLFTVPTGCFLPAPKVDSAVIRIRLHKEPPVSVKNEDMLFRVIRGGFAQRRKTLSNSLSSEFPGIDKTKISEAIISAGLEPSVRGERLSLEEFARLADTMCDIS